MTATVAVPRSAVVALLNPSAHELEARLDAYAALADALDRRVPWEIARPLLADFAEEVAGRHLSVRHGADQLQGYATHRLGQIGVDLEDERVLYEVLSTLVFLAECSRNGVESGIISPAEDEATRGLLRAIGAALASLAPDEAR